MYAELIDHAARVLAHVPTRCMNLDLLHQRTRADTALDVPLRQFADAIAGQPDRFLLLAAPLVAESQTGWRRDEREAYAAALQDAGWSGGRMVVLIGPAAADAGPAVAAAAGAGRDRAGDLLTQLLAGLAELLRVGDPLLHDTAAAAAAELESIRRALHHS